MGRSGDPAPAAESEDLAGFRGGRGRVVAGVGVAPGSGAAASRGAICQAGGTALTAVTAVATRQNSAHPGPGPCETY